MDNMLSIDLHPLASALQLSLSSDPQERNAGEDYLNQFQFVPKHLVGLLQIVVNLNVDISVRQMASIHLKNFIAKNWASWGAGNQLKISDLDRTTVRENLLEAIICVPLNIRVQLGDALRSIINTDYPGLWPSLLSGIDKNLRLSDQGRVYGALYALRILVQKFDFQEERDQAPFNLVINTTFPVLLEIFKNLLSMQAAPIEISALIKQICKIFWFSTYHGIPKQLKDPNVCTMWMFCFHNLLERPVPLESQPVDPNIRKAWGWWAVKKWTLLIMNQLHHRLGDPKTSEAGNMAFAQMFEDQFSGKFLESILSLLETLRHGGGYLPDKVINCSLHYLTVSISRATTYQLLQPHLGVLLIEIIFPLLCFNDTDEKLWSEDPHEYIRKGYDIIEDMDSPRSGALSFIAELVKRRGKENLPKLLSFIAETFRRYDEAPANYKPHRQKDGALLAVGALCEKLKNTEPYKYQLEQMLIQHVYPEFNSPVGHLRAKAASIAGQYASITFKDQHNFNMAMHKVFAALNDPEIPVRVDSMVALRLFIKSCKDKKELQPILPQLLDEIFKLLNVVENQDVAFTLETIVDKFGDEMEHYALDICNNLVKLFWKCLQSSKTSAAEGSLFSISSILISVRRLPHIFPQIEQIIFPILHRMLTSGEEIFEEVLDIVSYMTNFSPTISPQMWSLWPLLIMAATEWDISFFQNIRLILTVFISRGSEYFLTSKNLAYRESLFRMISHYRHLNDSEIHPAPKLIETVFGNCRDRVDVWVEPYLRICLERLQITEDIYLSDLLIAVVASALYYNAVLSLEILQKMGVAGEIFRIWLEMPYLEKGGDQSLHLKRKHEKKICVLGLISVLPLKVDKIPAEILCQLNQVFRTVLKFLALYKKQSIESEKRSIETDIHVDDSVKENESDEEECDKEIKDDGVDKLYSQKHQDKAFQKQKEGDYDDISDDDLTDDEVDYSSIGNVDPFIFYCDTMNVMSLQDSQRFIELASSLDFQHQAIARDVWEYTEQRRINFQKASHS